MHCELIDVMGDDLRVVNAARVSFDKESSLVDSDEEAINSQAWEDMTGQRLFKQVLGEKDQKLINYLAKHNHWTPFSHVMITMRETVPIFVARQRFKHVVGFTYNEVSRRYVSDEPSFYVPDSWRKAAENKKQGSSDEEILVMDIPWEHVIAGHDEHGAYYDEVFKTVLITDEYQNYIQTSVDLYNAMLKAGVAPEQARMVLPQSMYTSYYTTGSLAAWTRAYKLRSEETAQQEIRNLAHQWGDIISSIPELKYSWQALTTE